VNYATEVITWTTTQHKSIQTFSNLAVKAAIGVGKTYPTCVAQAEIGLLPIKLTMRNRQLAYYYQLQHMDTNRLPATVNRILGRFYQRGPGGKLWHSHLGEMAGKSLIEMQKSREMTRTEWKSYRNKKTSQALIDERKTELRMGRSKIGFYNSLTRSNDPLTHAPHLSESLCI